MSNPEKVVADVWVYLKCSKPKPAVILRKQHRTALYWPDKEGLPYRHTISLREDSWKKMSEAEKKLVTIHESMHACGIPHQPGLRTSLSEVPHIIYRNIYGEDKDWKEFEATMHETIRKIQEKKEGAHP